jgi:hypothetical protein
LDWTISSQAPKSKDMEKVQRLSKAQRLEESIHVRSLEASRVDIKDVEAQGWNNDRFNHCSIRYSPSIS